MSQAVLLSGIHNAVNRLSDTIATNTADEPVSDQKIWKEAVQKLEENDDGLTTDEMAKMLSIFTDDIDVASIYIKLGNPVIRVSYIQTELPNMMLIWQTSRGWGSWGSCEFFVQIQLLFHLPLYYTMY